MNYENLYQTLQPEEKSVKDALASLQKLSKSVGRETESGDLKNLVKDINAMADTAAVLSAALERIRSAIGDFDAKAYFESGDFAAQMLEECREKGVDVRGASPVYEMFPYKVRLDMENQDIYLDRKKVQCVRPLSFVETVRSGQEKLNKAPFNAASFAGELSDAYDLAVLKLNRQPESDIYLTSLYKLLAPMSRFRKDYDLQSYAFDLARLYISYISGTDTAKNGRKFQFGPNRESKKSIRILDQNGNEQHLSTIRFYRE
ncbi:MAG: hypothetical protein HFG75_00490 [Hungatella sp.]|nr:hypothetical protein [Hungatella sp.]